MGDLWWWRPKIWLLYSCPLIRRLIWTVNLSVTWLTSGLDADSSSSFMFSWWELSLKSADAQIFDVIGGPIYANQKCLSLHEMNQILHDREWLVIGKRVAHLLCLYKLKFYHVIRKSTGYKWELMVQTIENNFSHSRACAMCFISYTPVFISITVPCEHRHAHSMLTLINRIS